MIQVVSEDSAAQSGRAREGPFRALAENVPQLVWTARPDGSWDYVNARWEAITGTPRESALGLGWRDFVNAEDLPRWTAETSGASAPRTVELEVRLRARDGVDQRLRVHLERTREGGSDGWVGTGTSLDEPAPERALEVPEPTVPRRVLDVLLTFVAVLDLDGTILDVNEGPLAAAGVRREEAVGRKFWEPWGAHSPEAVARVRDACRRAARGEVVRYDEELPARDGSIATIDFHIAPLRDASGRVTHVVPSAVNVTDRKRVEAALRESEERARAAAMERESERRQLDAVLEAALVGVVVADARGLILRVNPAHERLWGIGASSVRIDERADWKGWWADGSARHGLRVEPTEWAMARALRGELARGDVVEIEPFDAPGTRRTIIVSGAPVRDGAGKVVGGVVAQMDITARIEAEAKVRRSEERYRLVARATNDVVWDWDLVAGRVDWNETVLEHFGCALEELGHDPARWTERIHPDDVARVSEHVEAALEGKAESWSAEYRFRKNDGSFGVFLDRGYIARDASGKAVRMIGSMLDITEQRRVEAALRESEGRFRALADNMSQLAWIADARGQLLWSNKRWVDYTGIRPEEMGNDGWERVMHPEHAERVFQKFTTHLETGEPWEDTFPARRADGVYRWFLSRAIPIRDEQGDVVRWFGTNTDVTEQREAEEALREADRHKNEFLAMLAHELRNPLAPLRNAAHVLRALGPSDPKLDRLRDVIDRQVTHMARLIDDLLDVSRIARGRIELRKERHDLTQIVRQTAEDYRASLEGGGIALTLDLDATPLWVDGDGTRLAQIVGNLLHNAGKFTERGGSVRVHVGPEAATGSALVSVEDTGIGIEPAMLPHLFDSFSQVSQGLDRSKGGLGLGLALAKALVDLHGGTLTAQSDGLGRGSSFSVRLPRAEPGAAVSPRASGRAAGGLRIVIVEDNEDAADTLAMLLTLAGHEASVAVDGRAGIEAVRASHPDVVICDIGLPGGVDGYAVGRALRAELEITPPLMIALSGYGQEEDRRRSREAGFDAHLAKPADLEKLQELLSGVPRHP